MSAQTTHDASALRARIPLSINEISRRTGLARGTVRKAFAGAPVREYVVLRLVQLAEILEAAHG